MFSASKQKISTIYRIFISSGAYFLGLSVNCFQISWSRIWFFSCIAMVFHVFLFCFSMLLIWCFQLDIATCWYFFLIISYLKYYINFDILCIYSNDFNIFMYLHRVHNIFRVVSYFFMSYLYYVFISCLILSNYFNA